MEKWKIFVGIVFVAALVVNAADGDFYYGNTSNGQWVLFSNSTNIVMIDEFGILDTGDVNVTGQISADEVKTSNIDSKSPLFITAGNISVVFNDTEDTVEFWDEVTIKGSADLSSCDSGSRGRIGFDQGGSLIADSLKICVKTALDTYVWKSMSIV